MEGRFDQARFAYGLRRMRNFIPTLQGPARKRPGNKFVGEVWDSADRGWLTPFVFSQTDAYILEWADSKLRFITDHGYVTEATKAITGITQASPAVFTIVGHSYSVGDRIYIASVGGMVEVNGRVLVVATTPTANTVTFTDEFGTTLDSSAYTAYTSGGTGAREYTIVSPYPASALTGTDGTFQMSFAQSGDVIYVCVPGYQTRKLTRSAPASWAFSLFEGTGGPFESVDPDQTVTVYASAVSGSGVTLTASSGIFNANHVGALFLLERKLTDTVTAWEAAKVVAAGQERRSQGHYYSTSAGGTTGAVTPSHTEGSRYDGDTGVLWEYLHSGYGWLEITGYTNSTTVTADVVSRIPAAAVGSGNASTRWAFGEWSADNGYPTDVAFFRERLFFFRGTKGWGSVPADFENFAQRDAGIVADDSAIAIDIRSGVNDDVQWIIPSADLLVGTQGGEFSISEISSANPLGPTNIAALAGPGYGARKVQPVKVNDSIVYIQPSGRNVRELRFAFETDGYASIDRTAFAEHIAKGRVIQMAYEKEPESIVWSACYDGSLLAWAYQREHDLSAWSMHPVGGTSAAVESVAVIPSPDGNGSEVYMIVNRTINGQTKRYVEYKTQHWDPESDAQEDMFYVDCGLTYDGAAVTTIRGLNHLEGETLAVLADGRIYSKTVSDGTITFTSSVSVVQAGLSYEATLRSMNLVRPGMKTRIVRMLLNFYGALSGAVRAIMRTGDDSRTETTALREIQFRDASMPLASAVTPYSGLKMIDSGNMGAPGREISWEYVDSDPVACIVRGAVPHLAEMTEK